MTATPGDPALEFQLAVALAHEADSLADRAQAEQAKALLEDAAARFRKLASRTAPADEPLLEREKRSETLWELSRVLRDLKLPTEADHVDAERVDLWKGRPPDELVDLAITLDARDADWVWKDARVGASLSLFASSTSIKPPAK